MIKFELQFKDGKKRIVYAPTFSSAIVVAAYKRHTEEGCIKHTELNVFDKKCSRINE